MARVRVVGGDGVEQIVDIGEGRLQIGRGRDNDIVLPDPQKGVSRVHAELRFENGHYVIVDLQSQNGTWINGRRVERSEVPFGAEVAIGAYRLTLLNDRATPSRVQPPRAAPRAAAADPLDDMRRTEQYDLPPVRQPSAAASSQPSRGLRGVAVALIAVVALAAVVWVAGSRQADVGDAAPSPSSDRQGTSAVPPAAEPPAEGPPPAERGAEPLDLPNESPSKRAVAPAPVNPPKAGSGPSVTRRPGESTEAWQSRAAALHTRYGFSKAALDRGDFAAAAGGFEAILLEEPGFLDAPRLLVQAQSGLRANARSLYQAGRKLDDAGDWLGALQKYEQARQIYGGIPGLTESLQRVRGKLRAAGTAAFKQAQQYEKSGQVQEALKEYEKALQWLPADDPNRQIAITRTEHFRRKG